MGKIIFDDELIGKLKEIKDTVKPIKEKGKKEDSEKQQNPQNKIFEL